MPIARACGWPSGPGGTATLRRRRIGMKRFIDSVREVRVSNDEGKRQENDLGERQEIVLGDCDEVALGGRAVVPFEPDLCRTRSDVPNRPVKIIVPYAAGGTADALARKIGILSRYLEQPGHHRRSPGRRGNHRCRRAPAIASGRLHTRHARDASCRNSSRREQSLDPGQLKAVSLVAIVPSLVCANPSVPASSVSEVIALAPPGREN